jgi:hypothetical protein
MVVVAQRYICSHGFADVGSLGRGYGLIVFVLVLVLVVDKGVGKLTVLVADWACPRELSPVSLLLLKKEWYY